MIEQIFSVNKLKKEDIASIVFSVTNDLDAEFPAVAARQFGLSYTPLLCTYEVNVKKSLKKCIRVLLLINSDKAQNEIINVYLKEAKQLRPEMNKE